MQINKIEKYKQKLQDKYKYEAEKYEKKFKDNYKGATRWERGAACTVYHKGLQ